MKRTFRPLSPSAYIFPFSPLLWLHAKKIIKEGEYVEHVQANILKQSPESNADSVIQSQFQPFVVRQLKVGTQRCDSMMNWHII